jgi:hypothetical protein
MTKKDWTEQLRERLADYEADAPEGLWADIERRLTQQPTSVVVPPQQKSTVTPLWRRWVSIAALVALVAGMGWWFWPKEQTANGPLAKKEQTQSKPLAKQEPELRESPVRTGRTESSLTTEKEFAHYGKKVRINQTDNNILSQNHTTADNQAETEWAEVPPQLQRSPQQQPPTPPASRSRAEVPPQPQRPSPLPSPTKNRKGVTIGLMANNGLMAYNHTNGVMMSPEMASRYDFSDYLPPGSTRATEEPIWLIGYEERQHHDHPISFGLTVSYPLTNRWTLSTGLVYTRLNSQFVNVLSGTLITTDQRLDYLGVPLNVQYHVLKGKGWKAYASAGAQIDWNIRAKRNTEGVDVNARNDHPQWSLAGGIGVEYDIIPLVGIYAEPGLRYYLKNDSKVDNFFKDQPFNWTLQIGIRLNLGKEGK